MAMLGNRTTAPCSAHRNSKCSASMIGAHVNSIISQSGRRLLASNQQIVASANGRHVKLDHQTSQSAAVKRYVQTSAAAQETMILDEPVIDFLGVNNGMQTVKGVLHVAADADLVYSILTDYDGCAEVFRNIVASETILLADGGKQVLQVRVIGCHHCYQLQLPTSTCTLQLRNTCFMCTRGLATNLVLLGGLLLTATIQLNAP